MSLFGKGPHTEKVGIGIRYNTWEIKVRVALSLRFFTKVKLERDDRESFSAAELEKWAEAKGFSFNITDEQRAVYAEGHAHYDLHASRHCTVLSFSRKQQ